MGISRQVRRAQERAVAKDKRSYGKVVERVQGAAKQVDRMFPPEEEAEKLVAVALIDSGGHTHHGFKSHSDLRRSLNRSDPYTADPTDQYGFWTSADRFVTREEAVPIGVASGQLSKDWLNVGRELLSSDVW